MPSAKTTLRNNNAVMLLFFWLAIFAFIVCILNAGCTTTLHPVNVTPRTASFDGTNQNSGVISFDKTNHFGIVTDNWRARYDVLIGDYSKKFTPPISADYGLTSLSNGTWSATAEAFVDMGKMELWRRNNVK